jgi:nicotinamidase-related amidase
MSSPTTPQEELQKATQSIKASQSQQHLPSVESPITTDTTSNSSTTTTQDQDDKNSTEEPYQELKWNDLPLFLNESFDQSHELLTRDKLTLPIHAGRTALLVVDVQPEYWSQCPAVRQDFPQFPQQMAKLVAQCRQQKAKIIWVRADYRYAHSPWLVQFARLHQGQIPNEVYTPHDAVVEWEDFATPQGGEYVIPKTSWSSTRHTALMDLLKQSGIDTVLVCGLITSVCVQHSAFGIFEAGYRTLLVTDACADRGRARHDAALALYGDYMYELVTVQDLCTPPPPNNTSEYYMHPAEPVWLTPHSVDNLVQPQIFNTLQDSVVGYYHHNEQHDYNDHNHDKNAADDGERTAMTSNKQQQQQQQTHYYEVEKTSMSGKPPMSKHQHQQQHYHQQQEPSMGNATTRTSNSSLSTLSSRPPQGMGMMSSMDSACMVPPSTAIDI